MIDPLSDILTLLRPQRQGSGEADMSRTVFAECFKALVGATPMTYLNKWRMTNAAYSLRDFNRPVGQVALAVGYGSRTSFSTAIRKAFGVAPSDYARLHFKPSLRLWLYAEARTFNHCNLE